MNGSTVHVWFSLPSDESGYPPQDREPVDAEPVEGGFRLLRSPVYASGVALGDVVATQRRGDAEWATRVVSDAGNWCARVVPFRPLDAAFVESRLAAFECTMWTTRIGLVVLEVSSSAPTDPLLEELISGREENVWDFDLGVAPDSEVLRQYARG
jgi:hypothetical protein